MTKYFVNDPPVAIPEFDPTEVISDTPPNVIYIRAKMDVETDGRVKSDLLTLGADGKTMEAQLGAQQLALLIHNIVRWSGPDLDGVPCTPATIRTLDPTEPHIAKVLEAIGERNRRRQAPNPKLSTGAGSTSAGSAGSSAPGDAAPSLSLQLATGISKSPLQSAITGRLNRSDD